MSVLPPGEKIVEKKICRLSGQEFFVTDKDLEFYDKISPVFGGMKYSIPSPTLCPDERQKKRLAFRNERSLFYRKCDLSGKQIVAQFPTDSLYTVYEKSIWYADGWDAYSYGIEFDFSRSFFEQFRELMLRVPRMACVQQGIMENSDFCNRASDSKNCYLLYSSNHNENSYYGSFVNDGFQCIDNTNVYNCQICYDSVDCHECQRIFWCEECKNSSDSYFLKSCVGCKNCLFCTNLSQKQYCIRNKQLSQEEYEKQISKTDFSQANLIEKLKHIFGDIKSTEAVKYFSGVRNENVSGNHIDSSKNSWEVFDSKELEDCRYCQNIFYTKNSMDFSFWGQNSSWIYEVHATGRGCSNVLFCNESWDSNNNIIYCDQCMFGSNLFACCGLKHGEKSIFNKSYSHVEYETLCGKIIDHMKSTGEWGEFFPQELSPFGYNETVAHDYFPMNKEFAREKGWKWYDGENKNTYIGKSYSPLPLSQYDERIVGYDIAKKNIDEVLEGIIECEITGKPFKIIKQELVFYIENGISIPTRHPDQRHKERMDLRNPRTLYERICSECRKSIITTYSPDRPEKVVCEECYHKLVY